MPNPSEPFYIIKRAGSSEDPYVPQVEYLKVHDNQVILKEIPDPFSKVKVKNSSGYLYEIEDGDPAANQFYVDYRDGRVFFNDAQNNDTFEFNYKGVGYISIPTSRIYYEDRNGEPSITLKDIIDNAANGSTVIVEQPSNETVIESRTNDPTNPEIGRMWLRTDL
ncbi:hypothetical protein [Halobacillus litoralis]|uniref:hypothetical protein n=1 Tax=Halobacillus litoralis TaxID=45668 RepID=UPI001CD6A3D4|nr:hypothetical protein [Halobacillus litoralis]MCA1021663.1 hypothetical protein [Halobacillus litoralis]